MFKKFRLKNYRTHTDTEIEPKKITLIIGYENSGKSNLIAGLNYFSALVRSASPESENRRILTHNDFFAHRHCLSDPDTPLSFACEWEREGGKIVYELQIYGLREDIFCKETIVIAADSSEKNVTHGYDERSREMLLRRKLESEELTHNERKLTHDFFRSLSSFYTYHFQPAFLKGEAIPVCYEKKDFSGPFSETGPRPDIAAEIGKEGAGFQELVRYVKDYDRETYNEFLRYLRRFEKSFREIVADNGELKWQFNINTEKYVCFDSDTVSGGLLKAAPVALLCAVKAPPAMIMLEDVENGISERRLYEFLSWIIYTAHRGNMQFILTSHHPSVIREFYDELDGIYNISLMKSGYRSKVTNLNEGLKAIANIGSIGDDDIIERDGKKFVELKPYELIELFYSGVIGSL